MMAGNLKLDVPPPPVDQAALQRFKEIIGTRPVVAAASTHPGEEAADHRRASATCEPNFPRF